VLHFTWKNSIKIILTVLGIYLSIRYTNILLGFIGLVIASATPLFIGAAIAFIVNIVMSFYERHYFPGSSGGFVRNTRRPVCLLGAYATIVVIVGVFVSLVIPQIVSGVDLIVQKVPYVFELAISKAEKSGVLSEESLDFISNIKWETYIDDIARFVLVGAGSVVETVVKIVSTVFSGVAIAFVGIIFSVYLLSSKERLENQVSRFMSRYLPEKIVKKVNYVARTANGCFHSYIVAQCAEAVILGLLCTLGMLLLKLPYAPMIGALVAFTALVPIVGAFIGAVLGALIILTVSPVKALVFIIFLIILQQIEENLIYPKVVGSSVNLPGIWVLAAITIGGGVMGILGILLAVPVCATVYRIVGNDVNRKPSYEQQEQEKPDTAE